MKVIKPIISFAMSKFVPALVLTFVACSMTLGQDVRTNYMPGTDFSKYHTYTWVDEVQGVPSVGGHPDQILDTQVKQAIDSQMAAKGLTKVADGGKPDLLLGYQLAIDQEKQINGFASGHGRLGPVGGRPRFIFGEYFQQLHWHLRHWDVRPCCEETRLDRWGSTCN